RSNVSPSARTRYCCGPASFGSARTTLTVAAGDPTTLRVIRTRAPALNLVCAMDVLSLEIGAWAKAPARLLYGWGAAGSKARQMWTASVPPVSPGRAKSRESTPAHHEKAGIDRNLFGGARSSRKLHPA